jgi:PKD repeat protein
VAAEPAGPRPKWRTPRSGGRAVAAVLVAALMAVPGAVLLAELPARPGGALSDGPGPSGSPVVVAPAFVPAAGAVDLGPVPANRTIDVAVGLAPTDPAGLAARTDLEYTPGSPEFHHFLTPTQVADRFGPNRSGYARAVAYLEEEGLSVETSPDRLLLVATGPSAKVAAAFGTSFEQYSLDGRVVFSHPTAARLPAGPPWAGVIGLGNVTPPRPAVAAGPGLGPRPLGSCSSSLPFAPCAIANAYNTTALLSAGINGTGVRIGVVDTYDGSESQSTLESDLTTFTSSYGLRNGSVEYRYPVPTGRDLNATSTGWGLEEALDLEWSRAMAPGATIEMTFAPDPTAGLYGAVDWLVAHQAVDVLSLSWGEPDVGTYNSYQGACAAACNASADGSYTLLHPVLAEAAAEGIGVFSSSGDCGAADGTDGVSTSYPASDPAATGVGGTTLTLSNGTYGSEGGWGGNASGSSSPGCSNQGGSGGGYAPFPRPYWQTGTGVPMTPATRGVPDVALVGGDPVAIEYNGFSTGVEGTSAGTPMWSGFEAIADQYAGGPLGLLTPSLYRIAGGPNGSAAFHDVTTGWNGYFAGIGWDPVTGLGTPDVGALVPQLSVGTVPPANLSVSLAASPRIGAAPLQVGFTVNITGAAASYPLVDVDFGDGTASLVTQGVGAHSYGRSGVYVARAVAFDPSGNSSVSSPVAVVVGGSSLNVSLTASRLTILPGQPVTLSATVTGGTSPYSYWFAFGDGTYLDNTTAPSVAHTFPYAGGFCASVVAIDSGRPPDGGVSTRIALTVGSGSSPTCDNAPPLVANLTSAVTTADLPGDLPLSVSTQGGVAPFSVAYVSDDPYVAACDCGVFHTPGTHTITAFVNDSLNQETTARLNVTILPALNATFAHSALSGRAPFSATFSDQASGGDGTGANRTAWTFGDGSSATGASVSHTWVAAGFFTVLGQLNDSHGGVASAAFLVDVLPFSSVAPLVLTASISPAVRVPAGTSVAFSASAGGGTGPYAFDWGLSDGDSSFEPAFVQTFPASACLANDTCPLAVALSVVDAAGTRVAASIGLPHAVHGTFSVATFRDTVGPSAGPTPLHLTGAAEATGIRGLAVQWTFGDGGAALGATATHTYLRPGNYTVTETVTDPWGNRLVRSHAIQAVGVTIVPPVVTARANTSGGLAPLAVTFGANATLGSPPYRYDWQFGDGANASGADVAHTYLTPGLFGAEVTVTDALGSTNRSTVDLVAYAPTAVTLTGALDAVAVPAGGRLTLQLSASLACGNLSAPGCVAHAVRIGFAFAPAGGGPAEPAGGATPGITGVLVYGLTAPSVPGPYTLTATVLSENFTGSLDLPLTVVAGATGTALLLPFSVPPAALLVAAALVGAAVAVAVGSRSRRPAPSPSRRPSGRGGRRAG